MNGLTVMETKAVDRLINQIQSLAETIKGLQNNEKQWMTLKEVC